jgi:hypothetical protein
MPSAAIAVTTVFLMETPIGNLLAPIRDRPLFAGLHLTTIHERANF